MGTHLWLLSLLEECLLSLFLIFLLSRKVLFAANFVHDFGVDTRKVDFCAGCNHISRVDPPKWYSIDFEWAGNEKNALIESLEEDYTLSTETTSKENEDSTRL